MVEFLKVNALEIVEEAVSCFILLAAAEEDDAVA